MNNFNFLTDWNLEKPHLLKTVYYHRAKIFFLVWSGAASIGYLWEIYDLMPFWLVSMVNWAVLTILNNLPLKEKN